MNRLKELREELGLSMREVAKRLEMPYTTYVNYEKGAREPNSETLIQLANFFHVSIDYLIGNVNDPFFHVDNRRSLADINSYEEQPAENGEHQVSDDDIKFALFGTTEIDDDVFEDVKALARVAAEQAAKRKRKKQE